ncbi:thermonuclease family protein [Oricola sp.]|uniref:thermonuclease family protein n=1 Tax=Oricola sp. TaxID=1979950 RepID=UPI0025F95933|nr:thermonuclease family protein [Oricola sp.]MCI5077836.1 thermonuclease family protein [Oricola sp.]
MRTAMALVAFFAIGAGAALVLRPSSGAGLTRLTGLVDRMTTSAYAPRAGTDYPGGVAPRAMPVCGFGPRFNCIVDGDTLWLDGEKIRIVNIDAPEVKARCPAEKQRASAATRELARLVHGQPIRLRRSGEDRYGRTLAAVSTPEGDVGAALVAKHLAVRWRGRREPPSTWCGA